jgi:hypothetical protein
MTSRKQTGTFEIEQIDPGTGLSDLKARLAAVK